MRFANVIFFVAISLLVAPTLHANTWHVPGDAPTIQAGLDSSSTGDTVLVAPDVYYENIIWPDVNGILLVSEGDTGNTVIDGSGYASVIEFPRAAAIDTLTIVAGFRLRNGHAENGGGIYCRQVSPKFTDLLVDSCTAQYDGGGIYCRDADAVIRRVTVSNCSSGDDGGGICIYNSKVMLTDCTVSRNECSDAGGGVLAYLRRPRITNCQFLYNETSGIGGGLYFGCRSEVRGCYFEGNRGEGGGAFVYEDATFTDVAFISNIGTGMGGGGIFCADYSASFENAVFLSNSTSLWGAGMLLYGSSATVTNCLFAGNMGNAFYCYHLSPQIQNCTFVDNRGEGATAVACDDSSPVITGSIFAFNEGYAPVFCLIPPVGSDPRLSCCNIFGNEDGDWIGCIADQADTNGNFSEDPLFCDAEDYNFTLAEVSPCAPGNHPQGYDCGLIGAFPVGCTSSTGIAEGYQPATWGNIKSMFE